MGRGISRKINWETTKTLQAKDDGVLDKGSSSRETEKWWDSEHILKRELTGCVDSLDMGMRKRDKIKMRSKLLS